MAQGLPSSTQRLLQLNGVQTIRNLVVHKHHGNEDMLASVIACFDEDYLDSLPKPEGKSSFFWPAVSQARNWRWLARYQISLILC